MEDAHTAVLSLGSGADGKNAFFGVYDGHGGEFLNRLPCTFSPPSQAAPSLNLPGKMSTGVSFQKKATAKDVMTRQ